MKRKSPGPSQLMDLFLAVCRELGYATDRDIANLAGAGPESVGNWRSGAVKEFKTQKFQAARENLVAQLRALRTQAGLVDPEATAALSPLDIEDGSGPADLMRQFRDRVAYDYLGHRFLYFEPQGALAWESLIKTGYDQDRWLAGVDEAASRWIDPRRGSDGAARGGLAQALRLGRGERPRGLDVVSLGPGEGEKEARVLRRFLDIEQERGTRPAWLAYAPVDVSIPLLLRAARSARSLLADGGRAGAAHQSVLPICADFEEGRGAFLQRLRTASPTGSDGLRLILVLGNVLGNLRDEETFVRQKLFRMARPGDYAWVEVGLRLSQLEEDPVYRMTRPDCEETATEANRRLLLEGPYRRWTAAIGRPPPDLDLRVWVREDDDSTRIAGSCNFCHDLVIKDERRVVTMLYSRRYELESLTAWFDAMGFSTEGIVKVQDSRGRARVAHLLLRRT